jgi:hypothetical protein
LQGHHRFIGIAVGWRQGGAARRVSVSPWDLRADSLLRDSKRSLALSAQNTLPLLAMTTDTRTLVETHWRTANARDWAQFRPLLHPELRYEVP